MRASAKWLLSLAMTLACVMGVGFSQTNSASAGHAKNLLSTSPVRILDCSPVTPTPCLFTSFAPVDATGRATAVALPPKDALLDAVRMQVNGSEVAPFYVSTGGGPANSLRRSVVLIAIDISGSMNERSAGSTSRFEAAREAIKNYLESTQEGIDRVAIVPFESHQVVTTIQAAVFSDRKADLLGQLAALPPPSPKNNTALYQAVFTGVDTLAREVAQEGKAGDVDAKLIVMTDGKNEVLRGDDANVLNGPLGLEQASAKVHASGLDVIGIGFGEASAIDLPALTRLSTRHFLAQNVAELEQIFRSTQTLHPAEITVGFLSPWQDRQSLLARDLAVGAVLTLPDRTTLRTGDAAWWHAPAAGVPLYAGHAGDAEMQALIRRSPLPLSAWNTLLRALLVLVGFSAFLLLLWFWVPRLVWPGGVLPPTQRWSKSSQVQASAVQVRSPKTPAGFSPSGDRTISQRSPGQVTQVQPRGEFSHTRRISDA